MNADLFNQEQLRSGALRPDHLTVLIECFQRWQNLSIDGRCGPVTLLRITKILAERMKNELPRGYPLGVLPDGRRPIITSGFWTENQDRDGLNGKRHMGVDFAYRWFEADPKVPTGDGGAVTVNGKRRWWYPPEGYCARARQVLAAASGKVVQAGAIETGLRCWVEHENGLKTGYFHLKELFVHDSQVVAMWQPLGIVGHNPTAKDPAHLHFEVSPILHYAPTNPRSWLERAVYITA